MIDLEQLVQNALKEMAANGKIVEIIDKHTERLVNDVVSSVLARYSEFGKALSTTLTESLKIDVGNIGLAEYNQTVLTIIRRKLEHTLEEVGRKQLEEDLTEMLSHSVPAKITLEKFIDDFKEWAREDLGIEDYDDGDVTAFFDEKGHGSRWLYLDRRAGIERYRCDFAILLRDDGSMATVMFHGKDSERILFLGRLRGFERDIFNMYVAKTRITFGDDDEIDTHIYSKHD